MSFALAAGSGFARGFAALADGSIAAIVRALLLLLVRGDGSRRGALGAELLRARSLADLAGVADAGLSLGHAHVETLVRRQAGTIGRDSESSAALAIIRRRMCGTAVMAAAAEAGSL